MTLNFEKIWESKRTLRRKLAARPIAERLAMLDALRDREIALRSAIRAPESESATLPHPRK